MTDGTATSTAAVTVEVLASYLPQPIAYYRLDGSGAEATGNNINLNSYGSPRYSGSMNPGLGAALDLNGFSALMANGFAPSRTGSLTISAWVLSRDRAIW